MHRVSFSLASPLRLLSCVLTALSLAGISSCSDDPLAPKRPQDGLETVQPEDIGWSPDKLELARQFAEESGYAAVMAAYDGKVFVSWGQVETNYQCHSIRKPFLSALYGIHAAQFDFDATLAQLGIDDIPPSLTADEKQAILREILQSRSGVYHEAAAETDAMAAMRPPRGSHAHGTFFYYNNWDFNVAGTVFMQETGLDLFDAFQREIATPLKMQDFSVDNCSYSYEMEKSMHPAYPFRMSARDMLRFGVLFQKHGVWLGQQIVPADWIEESTRAASLVDEASGVSYGMMWDVIPPGSAMAEALGSSGFYHTGLGVHALVILPDLKLVLVERMDTDGPWSDPGEAGMALGMMIIQARQDDSP